MPDSACRQCLPGFIGKAHFGVRDGRTNAHQSQGFRGSGVDYARGFTDAKMMAVEMHHAISTFGAAERHGQGGFREAVHRVHGRLWQATRCHALEEFFSEFGRDGLGAVEQDAHVLQVHAIHGSVTQHLQEVAIAEIG